MLVAVALLASVRGLLDAARVDSFVSNAAGKKLSSLILLSRIGG